MTELEPRVPGSELFEFVRGVTYDKRDARDTPFPGSVGILRATNITERGLTYSDLVFVPEARASTAQRIRKGDIVIAMSSGSASVVGKAAQAVDDNPGVAFGAFCGVVRPRSPSAEGWLRHYFDSPEYRAHVRSAAKGVNINNLRASMLLEMLVPTLPEGERQATAAKLDALRGRSRRANEALDAVPALLDRLRQSILAAAFRGDLTADWREQHPDVEPASELLKRIRLERRKRWEEAELAKMLAKGKPPKDDRWKSKYVEPEPVDPNRVPDLPEGWCWARWGELSEWITYGFTRPMPHVSDGPRIVTARHVMRGVIDFTSTHNTSEDAFGALSEKDCPQPGDILITKDGTIGRAAVVPSNAPPFCINQSVCVVWLRGCPIDRRYLLYAIEAPLTQAPVAEVARGMAVQHLSITDFAQIAVPLAPAGEVAAIVSRVDAAMTSARRVEVALQDGISALASADAAILADAFRGHLQR